MSTLIIDNYDSFVFNVAQALGDIGGDFEIKRNDDPAILTADFERAVISPGPGIPRNAGLLPEFLRRFAARKKLLGICLGHQMICLAYGAKTYKLKFGHRGANQPVVETATGKVFITSQNHGYAVSTENLPSNCRVSFINANDSTCEGIEYTDMPAFTVQFHPEASAGPLDTKFLFDKFLELIKEVNFNAVK